MSTPRRPSPGGDRHHRAPGGIPLSYREIEESTELSAIEHEGQEELLTLNMGPHHPATHGVLRLLCTLEGEVVRDMKPMIGYVHTGIEKTAEDKAYWKVIPVVERMDYLAYYFNARRSAARWRRSSSLEVPPRAQYLRVIHSSSTGSCPTWCGWVPARWTSARCRCSGTASATASRSSTCSRCPPASACTRATSRSAA